MRALSPAIDGQIEDLEEARIDDLDPLGGDLGALANGRALGPVARAHQLGVVAAQLIQRPAHSVAAPDEAYGPTMRIR